MSVVHRRAAFACPFSLLFVFVFGFVLWQPELQAHGDHEHDEAELHKLSEDYIAALQALQPPETVVADAPTSADAFFVWEDQKIPFQRSAMLRVISAFSKLQRKQMQVEIGHACGKCNGCCNPQAVAKMEAFSEEFAEKTKKSMLRQIAGVTWKMAKWPFVKTWESIVDGPGMLYQGSGYFWRQAFAHSYTIFGMIIVSQGLWETFESYVMGPAHFACHVFNAALLSVTSSIEQFMGVLCNRILPLSISDRVDMSTRAMIWSLWMPWTVLRKALVTLNAKNLPAEQRQWILHRKDFNKLKSKKSHTEFEELLDENSMWYVNLAEQRAFDPSTPPSIMTDIDTLVDSTLSDQAKKVDKKEGELRLRFLVGHIHVQGLRLAENSLLEYLGSLRTSKIAPADFYYVQKRLGHLEGLINTHAVDIATFALAPKAPHSVAALEEKRQLLKKRVQAILESFSLINEMMALHATEFEPEEAKMRIDLAAHQVDGMMMGMLGTKSYLRNQSELEQHVRGHDQAIEALRNKLDQILDPHIPTLTKAAIKVYNKSISACQWALSKVSWKKKTPATP